LREELCGRVPHPIQSPRYTNKCFLGPEMYLQQFYLTMLSSYLFFTILSEEYLGGYLSKAQEKSRHTFYDIFLTTLVGLS
jgi:hypothetical protein